MEHSPYRETGDVGTSEPEIVFTAGYFSPLKWLMATFTISGDGLTVAFTDRNGGLTFARLEPAPDGLAGGVRLFATAGPLESRNGLNVSRLVRTVYDAYEFIATKLSFDPLTGRRPART